MPARLIKTSIALLTLLVELRYTLSRLLAHPLTAGYVAVFQALRDQWTKVQALEISLNESLSDARAQVDIADAALDDFATRFSNAVLLLTGQKKDAPLYTHFFKVPLHAFKKPVLNGQLKAMSAWVKSLETTDHPSLAAMKDELVTLVTAGKKASDIRDALLLDIKNFREQGARQQLFDQVNAERKNLEGALAKLALSTPGLPAGFQNQFFKPGDAEEPEETIASVKEEIKALGDQLEERNTRLAELEKEAADEAADAQSKAQAQAELDAINKEIDEKKKKAKELEDKLT